jgi:hypothetical protein
MMVRHRSRESLDLAAGVWRRKNDDRNAGPADAPLRHHRDRQHKLALQKAVPETGHRRKSHRRRFGAQAPPSDGAIANALWLWLNSSRATPSLRCARAGAFPSRSGPDSHPRISRAEGVIVGRERSRNWKRCDIPAANSLLPRLQKVRASGPSFDSVVATESRMLAEAASACAPNPVRREFGHRSCRRDRTAPCDPVATQL